MWYTASKVDGNDKESWPGLCENYSRVGFPLQEMQIILTKTLAYFFHQKLYRLWHITLYVTLQRILLYTVSAFSSFKMFYTSWKL